MRTISGGTPRASPWPPRRDSPRQHGTIRGPLISPRPMASRRRVPLTEMSLALVTPCRSISRAWAAEAMAWYLSSSSTHRSSSG